MTHSAGTYQIDDLTVDFIRRKVIRQGAGEIALPTLSFDTLKALIDAAPATLTVSDLIDSAWRGSLVSNETVTQRIRLLRKALQDESRQPRYIETVRNVGYRLIPPVLPAEQVVEQRAHSRRLLLGGVLAVLLIGAVTWLVNDRTLLTEPGETSPIFTHGPVTAEELSDQADSLMHHRNPDSLRHAIDLYEQALELEPDNQMIRSALSMALSTRVAWYGENTEIAERAEQLARRAAENGAFFEAEFALAFSLDAQGQINQAQAAYERAVALNPDHYGARASLAYLLQVRGKLVEALSQNMIAYEMAPPGTLDTQIASCLRLLGFHAIASEWLARSDRLDPGSPHAAPLLALDLITQQNFSEGRRVIDRALARGVEQVELYEFLIVLALLENDIHTAREILASVPESISHRGPFEVWRMIVDPEIAKIATVIDPAMTPDGTGVSGAESGVWPEDYLYNAMLQAAAGQPEEALLTLQKLEEAGYRDYLWLNLLPPFKVLHSEPAFVQIIASMQADTDDQRKQLLTADWIPPEWRTTESGSISPLSQAEHIPE